MDKLRRVEVNGPEQKTARKGYFHGFFPCEFPYIAKALIELTDGRVIEVLPEFIRFLDKPEDNSEFVFDQE